MDDLKDIKNTETAAPEAGENLPPQDTVDEASPSENISNIVSSTEKTKEKPKNNTQGTKVKKKSTAPWPRTKRAKKAKGRRPSKKTTKGKTKRKSKKGAKTTVKTKAKRSRARRPVSIPVEQEKSRKKFVSLSLSNFIIFAAIFSVLVASQIVIMRQESRKIPLNISAVEMTSDEEIDLGSSEAAEVPDVETVAEPVDVQEEAAEVVEVDALKVDSAEDTLEDPVVEKTVAEETVEQPVEAEPVETPQPEPKKIAKKPVRKYINRYSRKDRYTNGGAMDLDGPGARQHYLATNVIMVPKGSSTVKLEEIDIPSKDKRESKRR